MKNTPYLRKGPRLLNNFKNEYMKTVYAFGQPVPEELLRLIAEENGPECCNADFIETLLEFEYRDYL